MFVLKLALEMMVLVILFLLVRKSARVFFPKLAGKADAENQSPIKSVIFLLTGCLASFAFFWIFYGAIYIAHNWTTTGTVLVVNRIALIVPSLIFGFYSSTVLSGQVYREFFVEVYSASDEDSKQAKIFKKVFTAFTLLPATLLLVFQFNVYLKTDGENIYKREMGGAEEIFKAGEIKKIAQNGNENVEIYLANGQVISTKNYSGNINYFLDSFYK